MVVFLKQKFLPTLLSVTLVLAVIPAGVLALPQTAAAAPLQVTTGADDGPGSLRQVISDASAGDTITFASDVDTVTLTSDHIAFSTQGLTIDGSVDHGSSGVTITSSVTASGDGGLLCDTAGSSDTLTLKRLTLTGATTANGQDGGAIYATGTVNLTDCMITNNTADHMGGGIYADNTTLTNCILSGNDGYTSSGGGIYADNSATLTGCTVSGNRAGGSGGGVVATVATLTNCTVAGNLAGNAGGGVSTPYTGSNSITLTCCTVTGNTGQVNYGGGLYCTSPAMLQGTVVAGNYSDSGILTPVYSEEEISINGTPYNGGGSGSSGLFQTSGDGAHTTTGSAAFIIGVPDSNDMSTLDQLMATAKDSNGNWAGKLADNGGTMQTIMPVSGQMNHVAASLYASWGVTTDQLGNSRPTTGLGTVGALEVNNGSTIVTSSSDTPTYGYTTLRQALANVDDGGTVTFAPGVTTVTLTGAEIAFNQQNVTINGGSGVTVARQSGTNGRLLNSSATSGTFTLKGLTLSGGAVTSGNGGAILAASALDLTDCTVSNNKINPSGGNGGGIYAPTATLTGCTIANNNSGAYGGGIYVTGLVTLTNCIVSGNDDYSSSGGGIYADNSATLSGCTVSGNRAGGSGGGVYAPTSNLTNCTVSGNLAGNAGGGVSTPNTGTNSVTLTCCTVSGNTGQVNYGGGLYCTSPVTLQGTVVAGNYSVSGIYSPVYAEEEISINGTPYNGGSGSSGLFIGNGDGAHTTTGSAAFIIGVPVSTDMASLNQLMATATDSNGNWAGKLADNGGTMQTIMPVAGQMDKVNASLYAGWGVTTDQLGNVRPATGSGTVGAVELHKSTVVTSSSDVVVPGYTTLRQALANVEDGGTVTFASDVTTITLTDAEIAFSQQNVTIDGGSAGVTITRNIFTVGRLLNSTAASGSLTLKSLTLTGGTSNDYGGALYCSGNASLVNCMASNNSADRGAGIYVVGSATLTGCAITDNSADGFGGGIYAVGPAFLTACTVSGNLATGSNGGGICADGNVTLTNCTVSNNTSYHPGGGIYASNAVSMTNCTVSGNNVSMSYTSGGGIYVGGSVKLLGSVVSGNYVDGVKSEITIISTSYNGDGTLQTVGGADGTTTDSAYYVVGTPASGLDTLIETEGSGSTLVGKLADNGGPTQTIMPTAGSVLLDAIPSDQSWVPATDQRGVTRPFGSASDVGAVEMRSAQIPEITTQPHDLALVYGQSDTSLSVVCADPTDGGQLSYQWYSNTTASTTGATTISGATNSTYTPPTTTVNATYYYCVVTNTTTGLDINMATATSDIVLVTVSPASSSIAAPTAASVTDTTVTLNAVSTATGQSVQYAYSTTNTPPATGWQTGLTFSGLSEYTQYYFFARAVANTNYLQATSTGSSIYTADVTAPTGNIKVGVVNFSSFVDASAVTYALAYKDSTMVTITGADSGSGVASIGYITSSTAYSDASALQALPGSDWTTIANGGSFAIPATWKGVIYVRIIDNASNETILSSDGTVIYKDSAPTADAGTFKMNSADDVFVPVTMNGNTVKSITCGGVALTPGTDYSTAADAITFTNAYLKSLADGAVSFTVSYYPLGSTDTLRTESDMPATTTITLVVSKADQASLALVDPGTLTYGDASFTLATTGGSGTGAVTFSVPDGRVISISGDTATIHGAGTVEITVTKAGDNEYNDIQTTFKLTVNPRAITVTADNQTKCFGDPDPTLSWTAQGLLSGDSPTGALTYTGTNVGHYDITQGSLDFGPNYTVTFIKGTMTITNTPAMDKALDAINKLPKKVKSKKDADATADATRDYDVLSKGEKGQIPQDAKKKLKTAQDQAAAVNHTDGDFTVTGSSLPWNIRLVVTLVPQSDPRYAPFAGKLGGKLLSALYDVKLVNTLTGKAYEPPQGQTITVTIKNATFAGLKNVTVAHEKASGALEYIPATRRGATLSFSASSFSLYGIVSSASSSAGPGSLSLSGLPTSDSPNQMLLASGLLLLGAGLAVVASDLRRRGKLPF
ncbi:MAG: hypothetical protein FWF45_06620 [Coriobacteriia bacterium]|nr:hypothetical protein [Coriobacteriia bacterium]